MKTYWLILAALLVGLILGRLSVKNEVVVETVTECYTINTSAISPATVSEPIGSRIEKVRLVFVDHLRDSAKMDVQEDNFPIIDHIGEQREMVDSAEVELPIRDYTFTDDSTYRIVARGVYVESLPQIEFRPKTITTTRTETVRASRITHGVQLGVGAALTPKGLQPALYVGYGLSIRF